MILLNVCLTIIISEKDTLLDKRTQFKINYLLKLSKHKQIINLLIVRHQCKN